VAKEETGPTRAFTIHLTVDLKLGQNTSFAQRGLKPLHFFIAKIDWPNNKGLEPFVSTISIWEGWALKDWLGFDTSLFFSLKIIFGPFSSKPMSSHSITSSTSPLKDSSGFLKDLKASLTSI
jgi:hypothetical protein